MQFFQTTVIQIDSQQKTRFQIILSYSYILTKLCLHSHHINKYLVNGWLTNLQELLKYQYFTTCFHACNTISCRHNLLINCEILMCGLQSFSIVLNIKSESHLQPAIGILNFIKLYIYNI